MVYANWRAYCYGITTQVSFEERCTNRIRDIDLIKMTIIQTRRNSISKRTIDLISKFVVSIISRISQSFLSSILTSTSSIYYLSSLKVTWSVIEMLFFSFTDSFNGCRKSTISFSNLSNGYMNWNIKFTILPINIMEFNKSTDDLTVLLPILWDDRNSKTSEMWHS